MKRKLLIFATAFSIVAFISCSKEEIETQQRDNFEEIATAKGGNTSSAMTAFYFPLNR